jgi:hypothetical protein
MTDFAYCANCDTHTGWYVGEDENGTEWACDTCEEMWIEETKEGDLP